ncbi:MAG: EVE domain-containing protein [Planctomycetota bacterium]
MATFLLKTEPGDYSFDDLIRDKREPWDGVANPAAQSHMRKMKKGDAALIYHTGNEKRIAGLAKVIRGAYEDPAFAGQTLASGEPKRVLVDIGPVTASKDADGATLKAIKADERFADFALVRQPRLSVMPVPSGLDKAMRKLAGLPA